MLTKSWKFKEREDEKTVLALADSLNISEILAALLIGRGVANYYDAKTFFHPALECLLNPFLMDGMAEACERVIKAVTCNERITVYGDYDVDGTCAAAIMYLFLKELDANVDVFIPNRLTDGYGLSLPGIDQLKDSGVSLIITVDCGITALSEICYANSLGIDVIVCDHHKPKDELPKALAILDSLKPGCQYPYKHLSGAGVALKLIRGISESIGRKDAVLKYLDLVALAGAADIVPLTGENRILVKKGIELINRKPRPGILALIHNAHLEPGNLSAGQIVFTIAPRINAVGRMGDAKLAVDLFTASTYEDAKKIADVLEEDNLERRRIDEVTFQEAIQKVEENEDYQKSYGLVLHDDAWHPGVIGIVASRMVERYFRPTIMLSTIDGVAKGSARSIPGFNIYSALESCDDLLLQFGGHEAAAGLSIEISKLPEFRQRFNSILKTELSEPCPGPELKIDSKILFSDITPKFFKILEEFAPFGQGNQRPMFVSEDLSYVAPPRIVGNNHLTGILRQKGTEKMFDSIGFNLGNFKGLIAEKQKFDAAYTVEKTVREGKIYPQIRIKDIHLK